MKMRCAGTVAFIFQQVFLLIYQIIIVAALPCYEPCLYYAEMNAIRRVPLQNNTGKTLDGTTIQTIHNKGQHISAIALDRFKGRIFWYDIITRMIYRANLDGSGSQVIVRYGVSFCEGIAYDWSTDNIFWTDTWHNWIVVASSDGKNRKTLITENMKQPFAIVTEPRKGYLFWTIIGKNTRIERARLDGTERKTIVTTGMKLPYDLQIDYSTERLFWIDAGTDKVESSDFHGKNRRTVTDVSYYGAILMHPYSMAYFPEHSLVYFTDWYRSWVLFKSTTLIDIYRLTQSLPRFLEIGQVRILYHSNQPPATSLCQKNKGNCSHLCLKQNATSYSCECPTGMTLTTKGSNQCQRAALDYHLFVVDGSGANSKILHLSKFVEQPQYQFEVIKPPQDGLPVGLDFDQERDMVYWTDVSLNKIFKMHVNGSMFETITDKGVETPESVQIDVATGLLYVTDYNHEKIEVIKLDGSMRMDLVTTDIKNPRDLVLYHEKGIMFYSDWDATKPKIESLHMDGTNRKYIITADTTAPSGLAIDKIEERLYWCDMALDRIESSDLAGKNRRILFDHYDYNPNMPLESVTGEIQVPYGLTLHQDKVFWTDWRRRAVYSADKRIGSKIDYITRGLEKPMQVHAYSKRKFKEYKKLYFFSRAKKDRLSLQSHTCFSKNCTGVFTEEPKNCPLGYKQTRFSQVCANCSAAFGVYNLRCECKNWMSCAHRAYSTLYCQKDSPFMQFKVRECTQVVNPGHCPNKSCPKESGTNCTSDGDCLDTQKCCNTTCGMRCLSSSTTPEKHECQVNNGGCSHFCFRIPNSFVCGCPTGMTLQSADRKTCISNTGLCFVKQPCHNDGVCKDLNSTSYKCSCNAGFIGKHCEKCPECPSNSTCTKLDAAPKCHCISNVCKNSGTCNIVQNRTVCFCPPAFTGERCETALRCPDGSCSGHGHCNVLNGISTCNCFGNYSGKNCETFQPCMTKACKNNGTCIALNGKAACNCSEQFSGAECEVFKGCEPNPCANGGICSNIGPKRICICKPKYTGQKCESSTACNSNPCLNNGTCIVINGTAVCNCSELFSGIECEVFKGCVPNPCANGGTCSNVGSRRICTCKPEYTGQECETSAACYLYNCLNNGTCYDSGGKPSCHCKAGYSGDHCQTNTPCTPSPCKNNAVCSTVAGSAYCSCLPAFTGKFCETQIYCSNDFCRNGGICKILNGARTCSCQDPYVGVHCETHKMCLSNPCQNDGKCSGAGVDSFNCSCAKGYVGNICQYVDRCLLNPCKNGGLCTNSKSGVGYNCTCMSGFMGTNCETINACASKPCQNSGTCQTEGTGYTCICTKGFKGKDCNSIDYCASSNCRESNQCVSGQSGYTCSCDPGYTGTYCSTRIDYCDGGNICKNNGVCMSTISEASCICDDYYGGPTCEVYYGENMMQVTLGILPSSKVTAEEIKPTLADQFNDYCKTADCVGNTQTKRKKRNTNSPASVTSDDIMIPKGYPNSDNKTKAELIFAVVINANGKSFALPDSLLFNGFEKAKDALAKSLNASIVGYKLTKKSQMGKSSFKSTDSPNRGGLAAGLVVLALVLVFIIIVAAYAFKKKRREKETNINFTSFDNVLYQSNTDLRGEQRPNVRINGLDDEVNTKGKGSIQFSNIIYDGRQNYSELENADLSASLDRPVSNDNVKMEMKDGMVGMVNPYAEVLETERKLAPATEVDTVTIGSSTNLKAATLASLDDERGVKDRSDLILGGSLYQSNSRKPMVVKVRSVSEESEDAFSGFANPCATGDDYIFSEDDTREALDITGSSEKQHIAELNANEKELENIIQKNAFADHQDIHWTEREKGLKLESDA